MSKATHKAPSEVLGIRAWASAMISSRLGAEVEDIWTALQFDSAVSYFGTWIDNMLKDYDYKAKRYKHSLHELLADKKPMDWRRLPSKFKGLAGSGLRKRTDGG